jgi:hypothetical protein
LKLIDKGTKIKNTKNQSMKGRTSGNIAYNVTWNLMHFTIFSCVLDILLLTPVLEKPAVFMIN